MMIGQQPYNVIQKESYNNMSYPNILTPPSSNEDSPRPVYFVASPNSTSFASPDNNYDHQQQQVYSFNPEMCTMMPNEQQAPTPSLHFIEEPTDRFRFRYKSEMAGTHGSLNGKASDKSRKQTFPAVELRNCNESAIIRCSIYQYNAIGKDFMPHAHRLIKKQGKDEIDDPHDMHVGVEEAFKAVFHSMGIIHTAKKNVVSELIRKKTQLKKEYIAQREGRIRELTTKEEIEIKGLAESESKSINLNIVCLRFDAFTIYNGILYPICEPLYSNGINNLKSALTGELKIVRMDHCTSPCKGGKEIFILVERVTKKNVKIRFFELDDNDDIVWEDYGKFTDLDVHHQYAIVFKTPKYRDLNITNQVKVFIELIRPSDQARSEPKEFTFTPTFDNFQPGSKRSRTSYSSYSYDSSNVGSEDLPITIQNLNIDPNILNIDELNTEELNVACTAYDSEEFNKLFRQYENSMDAPNILEAQEQAVFEMEGPKMIHNQAPKMAYGQMGDPIYAPMANSTQSMSIKFDGSARQIKKEENNELADAKRILDELNNFVKTKPTEERCIKMLKTYLGSDLQNNALHTFISENVPFGSWTLLKFIEKYKQFNLVNVKNCKHETPLHLAIVANSLPNVKNLLLCEADVTMTDQYCNTPLHLAVMRKASVEILESILATKNIDKFINAINSDGHTPLNLAILESYPAAVKLLCMKGANINLKHMNNGYTPLRFAIESGNAEIVKYILSNENLKPLEKDFNDVSVFQAAYKESTPEILDIVKRFMDERGFVLEVKEEFSEKLSEDEMEADIKEEPFNLEEVYSNVKDFTEDCLNRISDILDESGNWQNLAELLEVAHCVRSGIIDSTGSITRNLISYALQFNNDTVFQIRNFLDYLDEKKVVQIIDNMARDLS